MNRVTSSKLPSVFLFSLLALLLRSTDGPAQKNPWVVGAFSSMEAGSGLPAGWYERQFKKGNPKTHYKMAKEDRTIVIRAESHVSASSLTRKIEIDPESYPILSWRWKTTGILKKGDARKKEGDDYPARLYVMFQYDSKRLSFWDRVKYEAARLAYGEYPPLCTINYIWANKIPEGTMMPSTYADKAVMIAVESGPGRLNQWVEHTRNVFEDYRTAFNENPPRISGIAIMTDTDDTGESALTFYGDISFRKK